MFDDIQFSVFLHEANMGSLIHFPDDTHSFVIVSQTLFEHLQNLELGEIVSFLENIPSQDLTNFLVNSNFTRADVLQDFFQRNSSIGVVYLNLYLDYVLQ